MAAPGNLTLSRHRELDGRAWHPWVRRGLLTLLAAIPVLALLNVFGQHPTTSATGAGAASMSVYAPARIRSGDVFEARVRIAARRAIDKPSLVLESGWFEQTTLNAVVPEPTNESSNGGSVSLEYDRLAAGDEMTVWVHLQVNPTNVGSHDATIRLADGDRTLLTVPRTLTVFP